MTISTVHADRSTVWRLVLFISLIWWFAFPDAAAQVKRGADRKGLIVLNPAHPHGAQIQHALKPAFREDVFVYAPSRNDLAASYSNLINRFNKSDTSGRPWQLHTYVGDDYLERMLQDRKGEVVMIASNNQQKSDYILRTAEAGLDVIADKPMALTSADFTQLQAAFAAAERQKRFISDLPAMSMRNQVACILQKELAAVGEIFGTLEKGSPDNPAVVQENLHYYYKRIQRPTWFFDVKQQGNGVTDVTTHLADLVLWTCFPDQQSGYEKDIQILSAKLWPTMITPAQFKKATRVDTYPGFLTPYLKDSVLEVFSNGEIISVIKDIHVRFTARWDFEPPPGKSDTHHSILRGTRSTLMIKPGQPTDLYIEPAAGVSGPAFESHLREAVERLQRDYPYIALHRESNGWRIASQKRALEKASHLVVPTREETNRMLAKYFITTQADAAAATGVRDNAAAAEKKVLIFGDSNTDTKSGKTSWVQPAMTALGTDQWINFADGGAAFRRRSIKGVEDMPDQLEKAKEHQNADVVIVALGTNEYHNNPTAVIPNTNNPIVGSFEEAMAKDIDELSIEDTMYDAIRYAFYTIRQRWDCKAYVILPIQRAAWNWKHVEVLYTALEEMAITYGFEIIDGRQCGIVTDFEKKGKEGRDLRDGLHPKNQAAKEKIAKMVVAKIQSTLIDL